MHRLNARPAVYRCTFQNCNKVCKKPSGLTQHKNVCLWNPKNQFRFPTPPQNEPQTPPQTPRRPNSPHAEHAAPPTPSNHTPRRTIWEQVGRSGLRMRTHPFLDGQPCDMDGYDLPANAPPPPPDEKDPNDFFPFESEAQFNIADFLFSRVQMSAGNTSLLMELLAQHDVAKDQEAVPPFVNSKDLLDRIDSIPLGDIPWEGFQIRYNGPLPANPPSWMTKSYDVWTRDLLQVQEGILGNPDFANETDFAPKEVINDKGKRQFTDNLSGTHAWEQADILAEDPENHGAMYVPVILGSDKTTVSVATGQNEYYPLYTSPGNIQNHVRRAHRNAISLVSFLAIPKTERDEQDSAQFRTFRRHLFHAALTRIASPLRPWMTKPRITRCGDGHFRRCLYGIGPYIADYPEQCLLACIVQGWCPKCTAQNTALDRDVNDAAPRSHEHMEAVLEAADGNARTVWDGWGYITDVKPFTAHFPRANIHDLLTPDLLHQVIKGTFKDHLVTWVEAYFKTQPNGSRLLTEMDRRIAAAPPFAGLRRFPQGRNFKQWTGDDSKALMKVFIPAITGLVPDGMVRAISAFLEFCYLVRRSEISLEVLDQIDAALARFKKERVVFQEYGIRDDFLLPRQHSLDHYRVAIQKFGAPNGLCSSITESKHIKAVKEPYRRSSRWQALGQMVLTNQRLDKLAAARIDFESRGMLRSTQGNPITGRRPLPTKFPPPQDDEHREDVDAEDADGSTSWGDARLPKRAASGYPRIVHSLGAYINFPSLEEHIRRFLYDQFNPDSEIFGMDVDLDQCPPLPPIFRARVYHSASVVYHAPSDLSGIGGMHREYIRSTPSWRRGPARHDTVFIERDPDAAGFRGLGVGQVRLFLSFNYDNKKYDCALVRWYERHGELPCPTTGMWRVKPDYAANARPLYSIIHIDSILRAAHLVGNYGSDFIPVGLTPALTLRAFHSYYVNKYADHHAHEIAY